MVSKFCFSFYVNSSGPSSCHEYLTHTLPAVLVVLFVSPLLLFSYQFLFTTSRPTLIVVATGRKPCLAIVTLWFYIFSAKQVVCMY